MPLSTATIMNMLLQGVINPSIINPLQDSIPINVPMKFSNVQALQVITGSFTPNNNTQTIVGSILSNNSPNFYIFICDGAVVLSTDNSMLAGQPILKFGMGLLVPLAGGGNPIGAFILNGMTNQVYPMVQNQKVNYTLIIGQAAIT